MEIHFLRHAIGDLAHRRSQAGEQRYDWSSHNRLTAPRVEETARSSESRYYYDALGRRIEKDVSGERPVLGWDVDTLAWESGTGEHGGSGRTTHYVYEPNSLRQWPPAGAADR